MAAAWRAVAPQAYHQALSLTQSQQETVRQTANSRQQPQMRQICQQVLLVVLSNH